MHEISMALSLNCEWNQVLSNYIGMQNSERQTCTYFSHLHLKQSRARYIFGAFFTQKAAQTRERRKQLTFLA